MEQPSPPTVSCVYNFYDHQKISPLRVRIIAWFVHNGILLLRSLWRILRRRGSIRRRHWRRNMWWRMRLKSVCSSWGLKRRMGSVRWRLWRMNMWRRMMLKRLFSLWILMRSGSVRRLT
jgi:hypothetical protein